MGRKLEAFDIPYLETLGQSDFAGEVRGFIGDTAYENILRITPSRGGILTTLRENYLTKLRVTPRTTTTEKRPDYKVDGKTASAGPDN